LNDISMLLSDGGIGGGVSGVGHFKRNGEELGTIAEAIDNLLLGAGWARTAPSSPKGRRPTICSPAA